MTNLRSIPSVGDLLASPAGATLCTEFGHGVAKLELRAVLDEARAAIRAGGDPPTADDLLAGLRDRLRRALSAEGRRAINATGIILHTGLGRAPLDERARTLTDAASGYCVLQADLATGTRSLREERVERWLRELTGCEAATVVNNNAAATMLMLRALSAGREVVLSRGQIIEIGGAFRMPEVMAMSGCTLVEVGTTNRTHLRDYASAITPATGALIHVHTSNFRVRGFTATPGVAEMAALAKERGVRCLDDLGSGALVPLAEFGLDDEPTVGASIAAGVDAACFSGDKLICGPQAGIIVGRREAIERIRKDPFARMFRVGKHVLAGLEASLARFLDGTWRGLPLYRMLALPESEIRARAERLAADLAGLPGIRLDIVADRSFVGSGTNPDAGVPTATLHIGGTDPERLAQRLRAWIPAVFARVNAGTLVIDPRTVAGEELAELALAVRGSWPQPGIPPA
jgi:L-seryl-tRNA(Ser) seleniumtransferase